MSRVRRRWLLVVPVLGVSVILAVVVVALLALQSTPQVPATSVVSANDFERALQLLKRHDPRRHPPGQVRRAVLSAKDLELLLNHGAGRWWPDTAVRLAVAQGAARVQTSTPAPWPPNAWLNLELTLLESNGLPTIDSGWIGRLPVPGWLAQALALRAARHWGVDLEAPWARGLVSQVSLHRDAVMITYTWQADTREQLLGSLLPPAEQARLRVYSDRLDELTAAAPVDHSVALVEILQPMFALAAERSAGNGADAAAENRAALLVLGLYVSGRRLSSLVPAAKAWPQPQWLQVTLHGRDDFPQHFMLSALIAAEGSSPLADAAGLYKELADARSGSGFSFNDIAADRAGTRFGELAVQRPDRLQAALANPLRDHELMPDVADLPEFLPEAEFRRVYGGVGAPAYERLLADIDARIATTPWLR